MVPPVGGGTGTSTGAVISTSSGEMPSDDSTDPAAYSAAERPSSVGAPPGNAMSRLGTC
jgi:hypothetical protein